MHEKTRCVRALLPDLLGHTFQARQDVGKATVRDVNRGVY